MPLARPPCTSNSDANRTALAVIDQKGSAQQRAIRDGLFPGGSCLRRITRGVNWHDVVDQGNRQW